MEVKEGEAIFYPKLPDPSRPLDDTLSEDAMLYDLFLRQISELNGLPPPEKEATAVEEDPLDAYTGMGSRLTSLSSPSSRTVGPMVPSKHSLVEHAVRLKPECPIEFIYKKRVVLGNFVSWRSASRGAFNVQLTSGEVVAIDVSQVISSWEQLADESVPSTAQQWAQVGTDALALLGNLSPRKSDLQEFWQIVSQRSNSLHIDSMDLGVYIFQERRFRSWINPFTEASDSAVRALSAAQRYAAALLLFNDDFHFRRRPSKLLSSEHAAADALDSQGGSNEGGVVGGAAAGYALEDIMNKQAMRRFKSSTRSPGEGDKGGSSGGIDEQEPEDTAVLVLEGGYGVLPENTVQFRESETFHKYYTDLVSSGSPSSPSPSPSSSSSTTSGNSSPFRAASVTRLLRALELYSLSPASMSPPQQIKGLLKRLGKPGTPDGARMALREMNLHQHSNSRAGSGRVGEPSRIGFPQAERGQQSGTPGKAPPRAGQATAAAVGAALPVMTGPTPWSVEVLASADKLSQEMSARREVLAATEAGRSGKRGAAGRMDYRSSNDVHPIICIDGSKAVFLDDAFSVSPDTGEILVHVVDVAGALRRYEVLQNVAMERVSSTFLPSGPLHMLPPQALAALKLSTAGPNEVITVAIQINAEDGSLLGARVFPSVIGPVFPVDVDTADEILDSVNSGDRDGWSFRLGIPEAVVKDLVMAQRLVQRVIEKQPWVDKSFSAGQQTTQSLNKRTGRYKQALLDKTPGNRMVNALLTLYSNTTVTFCAEKGVNVPLAWENRDRADAQVVRRFATQPLRNWLAQLQQQQLRSALKMEIPMTRKDCAMAVAHHNQRRKQMSSQLNAGRDVVSFESLESHCAAVLASGQTDVVLNAEGQGRGGSVKLVDFKVIGTVMGDVPRGAQVRVRVRKVVPDTRTVILDLVE